LAKLLQGFYVPSGGTLKIDGNDIRRIAEIAFEVNERTENIGARRLHTVMEKLLEDISFDAGNVTGAYVVDAEAVTTRLAALAAREDLARYVL
ncbi:MAG TPA: HslU--HslV peptidase ATPase subunit, partial [Thiobacillus sp.]